jgi:hypothetical protein
MATFMPIMMNPASSNVGQIFRSYPEMKIWVSTREDMCAQEVFRFIDYG